MTVVVGRTDGPMGRERGRPDERVFLLDDRRQPFPARGSVSSEGFADQERRRAGTTEAGAVTGWYGTQGQDKCRDDRNTQLWQSALILDEAV